MKLIDQTLPTDDARSSGRDPSTREMGSQWWEDAPLTVNVSYVAPQMPANLPTNKLPKVSNVQAGRRDWGVIGTSRSHWLERTCARRARAVKTEPEAGTSFVVCARPAMAGWIWCRYSLWWQVRSVWVSQKSGGSIDELQTRAEPAHSLSSQSPAECGTTIKNSICRYCVKNLDPGVTLEKACSN